MGACSHRSVGPRRRQFTIVIIIGLALVVFGLAGVRYAPVIVAAQQRRAQRRRGTTPIERDEIYRADGVRATNGTGIGLAILGLGLLGYGFGIG